MGFWILNETTTFLILLTWLGFNGYLFTDTYIWYEKAETYHYTRIILGSTLAWARASAMCLNFNCMLILVPVCRNFISLLRGTSVCCRGNLRRLLDKYVTFHRLIGYMIAFHAVLCISHRIRGGTLDPAEREKEIHNRKMKIENVKTTYLGDDSTTETIKYSEDYPT